GRLSPAIVQGEQGSLRQGLQLVDIVDGDQAKVDRVAGSQVGQLICALFNTDIQGVVRSAVRTQQVAATAAWRAPQIDCPAWLPAPQRIDGCSVVADDEVVKCRGRSRQKV